MLITSIKLWCNRNVRRPILFVYQKIRYGVSYRDCWSLDMFLAKKISIAIKMFAEMNRLGMPVIWQDDSTDHNALMEEYGPVWEAMLWKMVDGFDRMSRDDCLWDDGFDYRQEALDLFHEYYFNLWD